MGKLYVIVAPSGAGKTTIINNLFKKEQKIVTTTTRKKRKGEVDGKDYYFVTLDKYNSLVGQGKLSQRTEYAGNYYGVYNSELENKLAKGDAVVTVDYHGYKDYKRALGDQVVGIYLNIDKDEIVRRLRKRHDDAKQFAKRIAQYDIDIKAIKYFEGIQDYIVDVTNQTVEESCEVIKEIIKKYK